MPRKKAPNFIMQINSKAHQKNSNTNSELNSRKHTGVFAIHELEGLFLVPKAFAVIIFTPSKVLPKDLRVELGTHRRRSGIVGASDGERFPAADSGESFWKSDVGA